MLRFQGPAARGQYLSTLYRNDMQGADHLAFIGYLVQEVQKLSQRVSDLEAGNKPVAEVAAPLAPPLLAPLPAEVPAPPPTVPPVRAGKPAAERAPKLEAIDIGDLQHIVLDLPDEPPTKKRGQ